MFLEDRLHRGELWLLFPSRHTRAPSERPAHTWHEAGRLPVVMALLPQTEGAVVCLLGGRGLLTEQLHQPSPPPEVHSELVEKVAVHKRALVGHWGEETAGEAVWCPAGAGRCSRETPANRQERKPWQRLYTNAAIPFIPQGFIVVHMQLQFYTLSPWIVQMQNSRH